MATVFLVRHGLTAMTGPVLAGWTPDVHLDSRGEEQAKALATRLAPVKLDAIVSSPLDRCIETVRLGTGKEPTIDDRFGECRYGDWTGKKLKDLARDPLWKVVQQHPSAAVFPGGEALRDVQNRAVSGVREWNAKLGPESTWLACSHGDVIKAIVADALGVHLDEFQRISIDPCSVSVISYTDTRPFVVRVNDSGTLPVPPPARRKRARSSDAAVGGGAGT